MDETGPMANGDEQGTGPAVDDVPGRSARPVTRRRGPGSLIVRDPDAGVIGGVCQGIADRTGIDPLLLRLVAALAGLSAGLGVALYLTLWVTTPTRQDDRSPVERVLPCLRRTGWFGFAVLLLAVGAATVLAVHDLVPLTWWPIALIALLVIIMWAVGPLRAARA
ncbi:PspC domain protein, partial [Propionibacterium acidifaciens F0233]